MYWYNWPEIRPVMFRHMEGPIVMKEKKIKLLTINDAKAFVTEE